MTEKKPPRYLMVFRSNWKWEIYI